MSSQLGPNRLVPLSSLDRDEIPPATDHFHGLVRNKQGIFIVLNGDREFLSNIPTPTEAHTPSSTKSVEGQLRSTSWLNLRMPHLVCLPRYMIYNGPLLAPLSVSGRTVHFKQTMAFSPEPQWVMASHLVAKWSNIEGFLREVMVWLDGKASQLYPYDYRGETHSLPVTFGYAKPHRSENDLTTAVFASRDAFLPLLANIAFHFLLLDASQQLEWREMLLKSAGIQPQLWDGLEDAVKKILDAPVGGIIDYTANLAPHPQHLDWFFALMIKNNIRIPLYFYIGPNNNADKFAALLSMRFIAFDPSAEEMNDLRASPDPVSLSEWVFVKSNSLPPVEPCSGQKQGETYLDFFARRSRENKRKLARETEGEKAARLQRAQHAYASHGAIGNRGARIFFWEDTNSDGFYIRRARNRSYAVDVWDQYAPSQRVYDDFSNEWDICVALAPEEEGSYTNDDDDDDEYYGRPPFPELPTGLPEDDQSSLHDDEYDERPAFPELPTGLPEDVQSSLQDGAGALENVGEFYEDGNIYMPESESVALPGGPLSDEIIPNTLEYFFGFTECNDDFSDIMALDHSYLALGYPQRNDPLPPGVQALLQSILNAKTLVDVPADLLDLRQDAEVIWQKRGINVKFFDQRGAEKHESTVFILGPRGNGSTERYKILVFSAAVVLYIIRLQFPNWQDIITELTLVGIKFQIVVEGPLRSPWHSPSIPYIGLGVREEGYKPTKLDYNAYVTERDRFLRSPRGHLALYAGGIVGRIARLVIESPAGELIWDDVDDGAADQQIPDPDIHGRAWHYHCLTRQEEDIVCGVYLIQMNQVNPSTASGHQTARLSWWPQPNAFFTSGMHTGWWSPQCERWFREALAKMEQDQGRLQTHSRWKSQLGYHKHALKIFKAQDRLANEFLRALGH
ncbi:hypothetical protein C8F01DRAFT_1345397 [Mycena amicta]|nr:hypothetical protein C8F01DRAFT_1345397 [Mycena amicta]